MPEKQSISLQVNGQPRIVEAYPMDPYKRLGGVSAYVGITTIFEKAGFTEAARRSEHHPVMRKYLN